MPSRSPGLAAAVLAALMLAVGFVTGTFFGTGDATSPAWLAPGAADPRAAPDPAPRTAPGGPVERNVVPAGTAPPANYRVSEAELARVRAAVDVAPEAAPLGTARITGRAVTILGEPLGEVVVAAASRPAPDPYGEFSDSLGQGEPDAPSLDQVVADRAEWWARTYGSRYRAVTGADGTYAIDGLPAGPYRLSAHRAGYLLEPVAGGSYVDAGGTRDFVARPVVEFTADVRMPDGSEPQLAVIRVKSDRSTNSVRWTPDRRVIRLATAEGTAEALTGFVTDQGRQGPARFRSPVMRLSDEQRTLEFRLEPQTGIYGRILGASGLPVHRVTLLDLSRDPDASAAAFAASPTRADLSSGGFEFVGLAPGSYAVGALDYGTTLFASATVTVHDGLVEQDLQPAPPSPDDSIRVLCLSPDGTPLYDVQFGYAVHHEKGSSSGSVSRPMRDDDGAYRIPLAALTRFEAADDSAVVRITARHPRFGQCHGDAGPGVRELTLRFAEPCKLIVTVPGYAQSPYRGALRLRILAEREPLAHGGTARQPMSPRAETAEILDDGTAEFAKLSPGTWTACLDLGVDEFSPRTLASTRVEVAAPAQHVSLSIPPLYDVVVQAPTLEPGNQIWMQAVRSENENDPATPFQFGFHARGRIDDLRQTTFRQLPAGRYRVQGQGATKPLDVDVPGGPYVLAAHVIDCLRVAISDESGVLHRAGLRPGDLVTSIDGVKFTADTWWRVLSEQGSKKGVPLTLIRAGRTMTLQGGEFAWQGEDIGGSYTPASRDGGR